MCEDVRFTRDSLRPLLRVLQIHIVHRCRGCGQEDAPEEVGYKGCPVLLCCRQKKRLQFCSQCPEFPCERLKESKTQHPEWLDLQSKLPLE